MCAVRGWRMFRMRNNMKLVVGLGNPEKKYSHTPHNIGFECVDAFVKEISELFAEYRKESWSEKKNYQYIHFHELWGQTIMLVKPLTYMNESGKAVNEIIKKLASCDIGNDLLVIHDDVDLEPGQIRFSFNGGSAGHKGVESVVTALKSNAFTRMRIGVGRPRNNITTDRFVLTKNTITPPHNILNMLKDWAQKGYEYAANEWNGKKLELKKE